MPHIQDIPSNDQTNCRTYSPCILSMPTRHMDSNGVAIVDPAMNPNWHAARWRAPPVFNTTFSVHRTALNGSHSMLRSSTPVRSLAFATREASSCVRFPPRTRTCGYQRLEHCVEALRFAPSTRSLDYWTSFPRLQFLPMAEPSCCFNFCGANRRAKKLASTLHGRPKGSSGLQQPCFELLFEDYVQSIAISEILRVVEKSIACLRIASFIGRSGASIDGTHQDVRSLRRSSAMILHGNIGVPESVAKARSGQVSMKKASRLSMGTSHVIRIGAGIMLEIYLTIPDCSQGVHW